MNERMERAISKMLLEVVRGISSKYGLEISEIKKEIGLDVKIVNERERKKKSERIMLPFCGRIDEEICQGIKINYGLYTQCRNNIFKKKQHVDFSIAVYCTYIYMHVACHRAQHSTGDDVSTHMRSAHRRCLPCGACTYTRMLPCHRCDRTRTSRARN